MATTAKKKTPAKSAKKTTAKKTTKKTTATRAQAKSTKAKATVAKKTAPKKTTAKSTAKKVEKAKTTVKSSTKTLSPIERIRSLNISSFIAYVILGVASFFVMNDSSFTYDLNYQAKDVFVDSENALALAVEPLFSVEYKYLVIGILAFAGIGSILLASKLRKNYEKSVEAGVSGYRWLMYGIVLALLVQTASLMAGVQDVMTLKTVGALVVVGSLLGWISDRENMNEKSPKTVAYYGAIFAYLLSLAPLAGTLFGTTFFGSENFEWHVYAVSGVVALALIANLANLKSSITKKATLAYTVFEQRYIRINQLAVFLTVAILLVAFNK